MFSVSKQVALAALLVCTYARPGVDDNLINHAENADKKTNGTNSSVINRFPHAVLFGGTCGGSIISPNWVLSAGHCTLFSGGQSVLAGTDKSDDGSGVYVPVKRLVLHPRFSVGPYWLDAEDFHFKQVAARWDFLLAELETPLPIDGTTIATVKLYEQTEIETGLGVSYAGYGAKHHGGTMRHTMHEMNLETVDDEECARKLEQYDKLDMVCVRGRAPRYDSACNGDSGSGLVTSDGYLIGSASWVENDAIECRNGSIVVFSRLSLVRDWIRNVTGV